MVPLVTVANGPHARILAARLGAAGVVTELRGGVDGPYPIGEVRVDVMADELDLARQLLLADEVEAAFEPVAKVRQERSRDYRKLALLCAVGGGALVTEAVAFVLRLR